MSEAVTAYNPAFYDQQADGSALSASVVLDCLFEHYRPGSVVDVGCGVGTWLQVCREKGVENVLGIDGDYVDRARLRIPVDRFAPADVTNHDDVAAKSEHRRFDLAISLEVAEHLSDEHAQAFVQTLTHLSDRVLFSAAIPYQGGTNHVHENWPEYWAILFRKAGYEVVDLFRPRLWGDRRVSFWYRQNALLFVRKGSLAEATFASDLGLRFPLSAVHPEMLAWASSRPGRALDGNQERDAGIHAALVEANLRGDTTPPARVHAYGPEFDYRYGGLKDRLPAPVRRAAKAMLHLVKR